jgi:hypothetical protein
MNLDFLSAFANNPITLAILVIGASVVVLIWKGQPLIKELLSKSTSMNDKIDGLLESDKAQTTAIDDIRHNLKCNTLDVLRMTIYNEAIDMEDRLVSARRYLVRGGNGKVAPYIKKLATENPEIWKTIVAMSTEEERQILAKTV